MMKQNHKMTATLIVSGMFAILGLVLLALASAGAVDSFWSGLGGGLIAVGGLQFIRLLRCRRSADYQEKMDIENDDERNRFIADRAASLALRTLIVVIALAIILCELLGGHPIQLGLYAAFAAAIIFYFGFYFYLRKRY